MYTLFSGSDSLDPLMREYRIECVKYAIFQENHSHITEPSSSESRSSERTLFQGCSFSKLFTGLSILLLVQDGLLDLDRNVNSALSGCDWQLPDSTFPLPTIRQCLNMTSGLGFSEPSSPSRYLQGEPIPSLMDLLNGRSPAKTPAVSLVKAPGTEYTYSGVGYWVLQKIIEHRSEKNFADFLSTRLFVPLGLTQSTVECPLNPARHDQVIPGFQSNGEPVPQGFENIPSAASGGLWTTIQDMSLLSLEILKAFQGRSALFSKEIMQECISNTEYSAGFGLGMSVDLSADSFNIRKIAYNNGYYHQLLLFPEEQVGILVMTDRANSGEFIQQLIARIATEKKWPAYNSDFEEVKTAPISPPTRHFSA
ncbi:MAG: hypothetical protein A3F17_01105 [Gammaproteobacteria bacterium RIFCSPHIGHO2_12_FULL_41_15]|nr:MAG: hypothetical protein A3F17_01105 [Gammaproteobacteria bacterium RIFCSPHIGHO2_12_FULL_41_15]